MPRIADRRAKIELLRAAEAAFSEHGLNAAKVEDITARAGVSKGAFYLHFESKEDCFREILEGFLARLAAHIDPPPDAAQLAAMPPAEVLQLWHANDVELFEFCWQNRALVRMILEGAGGTPYAYLLKEFGERSKDQAENWIRGAVATGMYRSSIDPVVVASLVAGAYERLVRDLICQSKRPDIDAWCQQAQDLFTRGLLGPAEATITDREVTLTGTEEDDDASEHASEESTTRRKRRVRAE